LTNKSSGSAVEFISSLTESTVLRPVVLAARADEAEPDPDEDEWEGLGGRA